MKRKAKKGLGIGSPTAFERRVIDARIERERRRSLRAKRDITRTEDMERSGAPRIVRVFKSWLGQANSRWSAIENN